ncbi:type II toxin-antitoxin system Phd/YefM family antitoxin [Leadbettera azotonutricia]|uniref:Antitoxin n=1 Tax=Leadbettera azotonutricia (strain ATCC BAA-888 / DSM 13862 / ZAS-9) TaxID=545695 RepID=F5YG37_LEAAZ|nr:type II toxin-antitoxin system Phd/YefM family antitoxin [Leadbettera azotonutricia]AEF81128.1 prevent-host-death family protein [Leadbettera azotonutricia ZAS-9]
MKETDTWQLYTAKNKLSHIVERAGNTPQTITVRGKETVVILSCREYQKLTAPKTNLAGFLCGSLDDGNAPDFIRDKTTEERGTRLELPG